jgi:uncharacterized protein (DUF433 family)
MTLQELHPQLLALTPMERAEAIQVLTQALSQGSRGVTKTDGICGGDACVAGTRIPVWVLVSLQRQGSNDAKLLEFYPHLSAADLVNAWAYAEANPLEIADALQSEAEA